MPLRMGKVLRLVPAARRSFESFAATVPQADPLAVSGRGLPACPSFLTYEVRHAAL
jgi:hypothetical protein